MRVLQLRVPWVKGEDEEAKKEGEQESAELVVYYFGKDQGGSVDENIERWKSQFSSPDGDAVEPVVSKLVSATMEATLVELEGSYARGVGMGPVGDPLADRMLLAAVVETPKGNIYPQLHGPADLVKVYRASFIVFVQGITADAED
jgi:hypothetical protein